MNSRRKKGGNRNAGGTDARRKPAAQAEVPPPPDREWEPIVDGAVDREIELIEKVRLSQKFLDAFPCVAMLIRPDTREIVAANEAAFMAGIIPGERCFETWTQRKDPCPWCLAPEMWNTGEPRHIEIDMRDEVWDAHWIPIEKSLYLHYAFDITERKRAEKALRDSEEKFRALVGQAGDGFELLDLEGRFIDMNSATCRLLGYTREELLRMSIPDIDPKFDTAKFTSITRNMPPDTPISLETIHRRRDGTTYPVEITASVIHIGGVPRILSVARDITERKRADEALKESEKLLNQIMNIVPFPIFVRDENGKYLIANQACAEGFGMQVDSLIGSNIRDIYFDKQLVEEFINIDREVIGSGNVIYNKERTFLDSKGNMHIMDTTKLPITIPATGKQAVLNISVDNTERYTAENALREGEKKFRDIFEMVPVSIWEYDCCETFRLFDTLLDVPPGELEGHFERNPGILDEIISSLKLMDVNAETLRMYGAETKEDIFRSVGKHRLPEIRRIFPWLVASYLRGDTLFTIETVNETLDGRRIDIILRIAFTEDFRKTGRVLFTVLDITERKRAEASLQKSEELFRTVIEHSYDAITMIARDGTVLYDSPSVSRVLGYTARERIGRKVFEFAHPDDRHTMELGFAAFARKTGSTMEYCGRFLHKNGSPRWIEGVRSNLLNVPMVQAIVVNYRDITERKQAEEALRESEEFLRGIIDNSSAVIYIKDREGKYLLVNRLYENLFHISNEDIQGKRDHDIFPSEKADALRENDLRVLKEGKTFEFEEIVPHDDGLHIYISLKFPLLDARGEIHAVCGISTDITDRKRTEDTLLALNSRHEALLSAIPDIIMEVDEDKVYTWANSAGRDFFGEDVIGREAGFYIEAGQETYSAVQPLFNGHDDIIYVESWQRRKDGKKRLLAWWCRVLKDEAGKVTGALSSARDITEERKLEEQFLQSQKMEMVGRLAGGIAHDFNNILTAIIGYAELALMTLDPGIPEYREIAEIKKSGIRAANLTRQLLGFSRKQMVQPRVLDMNGVIADMGRMLRRIIGEHIELTTVPGKGLRKVKIDPGQVDQVITNLAVNSHDAMPAGGKLTIATANVTLHDEDMCARLEVSPGEYVMLAVSDTGTGMDADVLAHVFEPFFTTKGVGKGTGLGLSTCYGIAKQNKGAIEVESALGEGTTIRMYLPAVEEKASSADEELVRTVRRGKETVLVVEDEPSVREMTADILRGNGYRVISAADGEEALQRAASHKGPIHAILTDVVMPRMGGQELSERIHALHPGARIIFMSGYTAAAALRNGVHKKEYTFIQKPFSPDLLLRKLAEVIEKNPGK